MSSKPALEERRGSGGAAAPRLLLVDQDAWFRALADGALRAQGYRVVCTGDLETAARVARELLPDLVVFDVSLPLAEDVPSSQRRSTDRAKNERFPRVSPAYAILRGLELESAGVVYPVVLLKDGTPSDPRAGRFAVLGYIAKPFTPHMLVQQLEVHLEKLRFRARAVDAASSAPKRETDTLDAAFEGSVELFGLPAILEILHFNQLSGVCTIRTSGGRSAEVHVSNGEIVAARTDDGVQGADAVFRIVSWTAGRFSFQIQAPAEEGRIPLKFEQLLLEGMKRIDEERLFPFPMLMGLSPRVGKS